MTEHAKKDEREKVEPTQRGSWILMNGDTPWYVKWAFAFIANLGFPIIVSGFLLAMAAGYITSPISKTHEIVTRSHEHLTSQTAFLRAICRNTARTEIGQRECDRISDAGGIR